MLLNASNIVLRKSVRELTVLEKKLTILLFSSGVNFVISHTFSVTNTLVYPINIILKMPVTVTNTKVYIFSFPAGRLQIHAAPFMQTFRQLLIRYFILLHSLLFF